MTDKDKKLFRDLTDSEKIVEFIFRIYRNQHGYRAGVNYDDIRKKLGDKFPVGYKIVQQHKAWVNDPVFQLTSEHPVWKLAQMYHGHPVTLLAQNTGELETGIISDSMKNAVIQPIPVKAIKDLKLGNNSFQDIAIPTETLEILKDRSKLLYLEETKRGVRGVNIGVRLFVFLLSQVPVKYRGEKVQCNLEISLSDIAKLIYPCNDKKGHSYRRDKHEEALKDGFHELNSIVVQLHNKVPFRPVLVRQEPEYDNLESKALVHILWPPKSDRGMQINLRLLIEEGVGKKWAFNFNLALSLYWDEAKRKNKGKRVYSTIPEVKRNNDGYIVDGDNNVVKDKGKPVVAWNHPRAIRTGKLIPNPAINHLAWLNYDNLYEMAYTTLQINTIESEATKKQYKRRIRKYLEDMQSRGEWDLIVNENDPNQFRIAEIYKESRLLLNSNSSD